ncbi:homoserine dehydrogenase [Oxobacter pfennigii]|uniref:Homoserine dehydrogenase n=1 Tax=Oxobacter pfennigii TaxID=36849 RepID=A0A0P8X5N9_9CLOT|nr:homoserine dehydrogenase [Oxobacter pfennigii]KPU46175.1 homoserine dehydrogenase [Oxobacter pfennigii]
MDKVRIALLGLGNVGKGVWKILNTNIEEIKKRSGYEIEVSKILVRDLNKDRSISIPPGILTANPDDILNDNSVKIVVELLGGMDPAKDYILRSIENKKHIVTANKLLIATAGEELFSAAYEKGVQLCFEASVGGGIPIIKNITESLTANKIEEIIGIVNGTTNYILSKMADDGVNFQNALKEAQINGLAEADPTSDVEGYDALYKLLILASLAFDTKIDVNTIHREGIRNIESIDIKYAQELGYAIKLLAVARDKGDKLELKVHPAMVPAFHALSNVKDSFNAILIKGNAAGDLMFYGRGAGDLPTGSAVVGDIISILRNKRDLPFKRLFKNDTIQKKVCSAEEVVSSYYIRASAGNIPHVFDKIKSIFAENDINILNIIKNVESQNTVYFALKTGCTSKTNLDKALNKIMDIHYVDKVENIIRIEDLY